MDMTLRLIEAAETDTEASILNVLELTNDADPREVSLEGVDRIDLRFPKFSDGRAFSQAFVLRRRLGFEGDIRAIGDVLIDQLVQMQRTGFSSAVLRADQDLGDARRQFERYASYYQGDAVRFAPLFREVA
jgi:uncharacterized protein (DUF934 family)